MTRQPDDPGPDHHGFEQPLLYGFERADLTPNTLKTIRINAGRVSPFVIARAMCWSYRRLKRVASAEHIDIRYPAREYYEDAEPRGA